MASSGRDTAGWTRPPCRSLRTDAWASLVARVGAYGTSHKLLTARTRKPIRCPCSLRPGRPTVRPVERSLRARGVVCGLPLILAVVALVVVGSLVAGALYIVKSSRP